MGAVKRCIAGSAILALLAVPAVALAGAINLHGPVGNGFNDSVVDITVGFRHKKLTKVVRFEFANVPVVCTGGRTTLTYDSDAFPHHMKVSANGKFHGTATVSGGRTTYTVTGRFKNPHKASGTLRISGVVPQCLTGDSGILHWTAH